MKTWKASTVDLSKNKFEVVPFTDEYGSVIVLEDKICTVNSSRADAEENAKLIASAPELLAVLKYVLKTVDESDDWWMNIPEKGGFDRDLIEQTILKATL